MRNCYQGWYGERHYTLKEASKILGVTVKTLQNWDKQESPPAYAPYAGRLMKCSQCNLIEDRDFIAALNLRMWGSGPPEWIGGFELSDEGPMKANPYGIMAMENKELG